MIYETIVTRQLIDKGWSGDKKYRVQTEDGSIYLLRISPHTMYSKRNTQFQRMQQAATLGIPMCMPVEFGICEDCVYTLLSWIDGEDAEAAIPELSVQEQYRYGIQAGQILRKIHSIPPQKGDHNWQKYFDAKAQRKIAAYNACGLQYSHGNTMISYLMQNRHLLQNRPVTYQHGDYHIGNMMIDRNGCLYVIDFEKDDYGDPWEEFNRIVWSAQAAPEFARGIVDGYFDSHIPEQFWQLLAYYICSNCVGSLPWAISYGKREVETITAQGEEVLRWYDNMSRIVPSWYR